GRTQVRTAGAGAPVGNHALGDARRFVGFFADRQALDQVFEADHAADFRQDRGGVGVPLRQTLALGDIGAFLDAQTGAVRDLVGLAVLAVDDDGDDDVAAHGHQVAVRRRNGRADDLGLTGVGRLVERG